MLKLYLFFLNSLSSYALPSLVLKFILIFCYFKWILIIFISFLIGFLLFSLLISFIFYFIRFLPMTRIDWKRNWIWTRNLKTRIDGNHTNVMAIILFSCFFFRTLFSHLNIKLLKFQLLYEQLQIISKHGLIFYCLLTNINIFFTPFRHLFYIFSF